MANPVASPFILQLGSFLDLAKMFGNPVFMFFSSLLSYAVIYDFLDRGFIETYKSSTIIVYMGDVMVLLVSLCSAAYIAYKTTQAVIHFVDGFAHIYRYGSIVGNYMGQFEFSYVVLFYATAMGLTGMAIFSAMRIWDMVAEREVAVANDGFFGTVVSFPDCLKFVTLGLVVMIATYYSAYSIGETVDDLIGWFDQWGAASGNKKDKEGRDKENGSYDIAGTSLITDLQYHAVTTIYTWLVFNMIIAGSYVFSFMFLGFKRLEGCNLDDVNESYYEPVRPLLASEVDLVSCKKAVKGIFKLADLDKNQVISRCENAKFLYGMGNTSEYALMYSEVKILPYLYEMCEKKFPDYKKLEE